jgi:exodeoxyribonuclease V gamma subunit
MRHGEPAPSPVVIPSLAFADQLERHIAARWGVCMGLEFLVPRDFIHRAAGPGPTSPWLKGRLCWAILPHVAEVAKDLGIRAPSPRDRLALAVLIEDAFDQYGHFRPEMIRDWARGEERAGLGHEVWQRTLWKRLRVELRVPHPAVEMERLRADPALRGELAAKFPALRVMGTGGIDPLLAEVLAMLEEAGGNVRVDVILPTMEYLGDLRRGGTLPPEDSDPEEFPLEATHPLIESMGRHAVGSFLLLGRLDDQYTHWPEAGTPVVGTGDHLLGRLQTDLRSARAPAAGGDGNKQDTSLRVHACFGRRREMEVLCDEILRAFGDLPGLVPGDIHVVSPVPETYAPLVSAVLQEAGLPVRLTEGPDSGADPVATACAALLELARSGRHEVSALLEILQLPAVRETLGIDDESLELARGWIVGSGLTQGLGEGGAPEPGTWRFARDRLVAGGWFGPGGGWKYPDGRYVLPLADPLGGGETLRGRLITWFAALEETMRLWRAEAPVSDWADRLSDACVRLLGGGGDEGLIEMGRRCAFLRGLGCGEPLDAGALGDWLAAETSTPGRRSGLSGRITFGRFNQLHHLPCRVLAMVGMEETNFPGENRTPAWNLLPARPRPWDRNTRVDDRQMFLDALLAPSDRLIITASSRNVRNGRDEPFSSCVDELLRVTARMGGGCRVVRHRLQPFAPEYFLEGADLPRSFNRTHAAVASAIGRVSGTRANTDGIPLVTDPAPESPTPAQPPPEISLDALVRFWKNPAAGFLRARGILPPGEGVDDSRLDRAPFLLNSLQEWKARERVVVAELSGEEAGFTAALLRADRGLPPGDMGSHRWNQILDAASPLAKTLAALVGDGLPVDLVLPGLRTRLMGLVPATRGGDHLVFHRVGTLKSAKHFLEPWIGALAAAASGGTARPAILLDGENPNPCNEREPIEQARALELLTHLVRGFLECRTRPVTYAPQASDAWAKALASGKSDGFERAATAWFDEGDANRPSGEGHDPAALLAWRDRDPFENMQAWEEWVGLLASPMRAWGAFK